MIPVLPKQLISAAGVLLVLVLIVGIQAYFLIRLQQENRSLMEVLKLQESSLEEERQKNRAVFDSLNVRIRLQDANNDQLKSELSSLQEAKAAIDIQTHENKAAILRVHAVDSLRNEVARHYRR